MAKKVKLKNIVETGTADYLYPVNSTNEIEDFSITTPADGQALLYDATNSKWVNKDNKIENESSDEVRKLTIGDKNIRLGLTPTGKLTINDRNIILPNTFVTKTNAVFSEKINALGTITANTEIDTANGNIQTFTVGGSFTLTLKNTIPAGTTLTLIITNGSTGTITWPTIKWPDGSAPTLTTLDMVTLFYDGTNWYGVSATSLS